MGLWETVNRILDKGYPRSSKKYPKNHKKALKFEKLKFGSRQFRELTKIIGKKIPIGELAGTNTKTGKLKVSAKIPPKLRREVAFHEQVESKFMRGFKVKKVCGKGKNLRIKWEK